MAEMFPGEGIDETDEGFQQDLWTLGNFLEFSGEQEGSDDEYRHHRPAHDDGFGDGKFISRHFNDEGSLEPHRFHEAFAEIGRFVDSRCGGHRNHPAFTGSLEEKVVPEVAFEQFFGYRLSSIKVPVGFLQETLGQVKGA